MALYRLYVDRHKEKAWVIAEIDPGTGKRLGKRSYREVELDVAVRSIRVRDDDQGHVWMMLEFQGKVIESGQNARVVREDENEEDSKG